jgi:hypothetical protein
MQAYKTHVLLLCMTLCLSACHGDSGAQNSAATRPHFAPKKGPSASDLTRGMVDAAGVGKSQLEVSLKFDLKQRPVLGQPLSIDVAVLPQTEGDPASLTVNGGNGISVAPQAGTLALPAMQPGEVYRQTVVVTPTSDGVLVLSLNVSVHHDDVVESRAFSIPLIVDPLT